MTERFVLGSPQLFWPLLLLWLLISAGMLWSTLRAPVRSAWLYLAFVLKAFAIGLLLAALLEPMLAGEKARQQANYFAVLVDNSQSMKIESEAAADNQPPVWTKVLDKEQPWQVRLGQDFQLRRYKFDRQLQSIQQFDELDWSGSGSQIGDNLIELGQRYQGRPLAGILLFTDGNSTDNASYSERWKSAGIPVYPVQTRKLASLTDINIKRVAVTQTDFEASPVTLLAQISANGLAGKEARLSLLNSKGDEIRSATLKLPNDGEILNHPFQFRPDGKGVQGFQVKAQLVDELQLEAGTRSSEATLLNNSRFAVVDRGIGPYRILYLAGRPNWEFKFIRRALDSDEELKLVSLLRIARKEPKFSFRDSKVDSANPLFSGFEDIAEEDKEAYDEPVLIRLGVEQSDQLSKGFPKSAEELFEYHAIILDDIEHEFFTQEQLLLLRQFVSMRGGGLLMLGGQETLRGESLRNSPLGEILPVYPDDATAANVSDEPQQWRWELTREGWLQPWLRLTDNEDAEKKLLSQRTVLGVVNSISGLKPGASVLVDTAEENGTRRPLMAAQKFGKGKSAAIMAGDLWRWAMHRESMDSEAPLMAAWRQTVRWLIADVPKRLQISVDRVGKTQSQITSNGNPLATTLRTSVYDSEFKPVENVQLTYTIYLPSGKQIALRGEPSENVIGAFETSLVSSEEGIFRVEVIALAEDGSEIGRGEAGWISEPSAEEFEQLLPNSAWLRQIASETKGEVIAADQLESFVKGLPERSAPVTENYAYPIWHEPWVILCAISLFCLEWGIRRKSGLP
jgi:uncharacterized membrane protein